MHHFLEPLKHLLGSKSPLIISQKNRIYAWYYMRILGLMHTPNDGLGSELFPSSDPGVRVRKKYGYGLKFKRGYGVRNEVGRDWKCEVRVRNDNGMVFEIVSSEEWRIRIVFQSRGTSSVRKTELVRKVKKSDWKIYKEKGIPRECFPMENGKLHKSSKTLLDIISCV